MCVCDLLNIARSLLKTKGSVERMCVCVCVCMYVCISYDCIAIISRQALTDWSLSWERSLLAGRNGIVKLDFQELDAIKV